jgi:uncharacterized membrane protein YjgN (DUF898 family)
MSLEQAGAGTIRHVDYEGQGATIWGIALGNLGLNILTIGFWRFWGAVRVRRYLWSQTRFDGDAFEYTGTGGELFKGFLLAVLLFGLPLFALSLLAEFFSDDSILSAIIDLAVYGFVLVMGAIGIYRARRYRLSRTQWRGIRGGLAGSALDYLWRCALWILSAGFSAGLAHSWGRCLVTRYVWTQTEFGNQPFKLVIDAWALFRKWLAVWLLGVLIVAALLGAGSGIFNSVLFGNNATTTSWAFSGMLTMALALVMAWFYARYRTFELQLIASGMEWGNLRFQLDIGPGRFLWVVASNALIVLVTLGVGTPYALHRWFRLIAGSLVVFGEQDFETILQNQSSAPRTGEGLVALLNVE